MGDLPSADVKPPENVLFVCQLNAITQVRIGSAEIDDVDVTCYCFTCRTRILNSYSHGLERLLSARS